MQAGLRDPVDLVTANVPPIDPVDENGEPLRTNVVVLTRQLSDLYDAALDMAEWGEANGVSVRSDRPSRTARTIRAAARSASIDNTGSEAAAANHAYSRG